MAMTQPEGPDPTTDPNERRINRQFQWIERLAPSMQRPLTVLRARGWWIVRVPVALLLVLGGMLAFLPVLGIWMLPLGLLLLAVDIPVLRPIVAGFMIRARRSWAIWSRRLKQRYKRRK